MRSGKAGSGRRGHPHSDCGLMRIAIYDNLPPGGAKRTAFEFGRQLAQRHQVDLYRLNTTSRQAYDLASVTARVYEYRYSPFFGLLDHRLAGGHLAPRSATMFGPLRRLHRRIARDLVDRGYNAVLAHTDAMTQSPYLLRWLGQRGLYYCHDVLRIGREETVKNLHRDELRDSPPPIGTLRLLEDGLVTRRWLAADRRTVRAAGGLAVNSIYTREQTWAAYGREAVVCHPGVDVNRFTPADRDEPRDSEVLSIGSPLSIKGHDLVIRALALITPAGSRPRLRLVASADRGLEPLRALADRLGVQLHPDIAIDEETLVSRYRTALATVCAARLEPFGLTPLESMACGTPVVAIREAGFRDSVIDGETGLLVEPRADELASAISRLASTPALARELGRRGREVVVDRWTWEHRTPALEAALLAVTA